MTTEELRTKLLDWCENTINSSNLTTADARNISEVYANIAKQDNLSETMSRIANGGNCIEPVTFACDKEDK